MSFDKPKKLIVSTIKKTKSRCISLFQATTCVEQIRFNILNYDENQQLIFSEYKQTSKKKGLEKVKKREANQIKEISTDTKCRLHEQRTFCIGRYF